MEPLPADDLPAVRNWPPRLQAVAVVVWSSFLAASLCSVLAFAAVDPQLIIDGLRAAGMADAVEPSWWLNRTGLYTLSFCFFWLIALVAGALTAFLIQGRERDQRP